MAFDEDGQADSVERKVSILTRAYRLAVDVVGIPPSDLILDPCILTIGTGMSEHDAYAVDFIESIRLLHESCPGALISGGLSNLSFAFRGHSSVREAIHAVFLYHAVHAGLDMAIVNPAALIPYDDIPVRPARARRGPRPEPARRRHRSPADRRPRTSTTAPLRSPRRRPGARCPSTSA